MGNGAAGSGRITVHLRQRKIISKGQDSLYLEYYKGSYKTPEGKVRPIRDYEYLNLYVFPKPKTHEQKEQNRHVLDLARAIKAKRELEIKNGQHGFASGFEVDASLLGYFAEQVEKKISSKNTEGNWKSALKHLRLFVQADYHEGITFRAVDRDFCEKFKAFLSERARTTAGERLSSASQNSYFAKFKACLRQAVKDRVIQNNPSEGVVLPRVVSHKREYLTHEELLRLVKAECRYDVLKRAFLFSCLTGLRWSDIHKMTWKEVQQTDIGWRVTFHHQKTKNLQYLDISGQARELLGKKAGMDDRVFIGLKYSSYMNVALMQWMLKADITKDITFHCGRHTFAVLQLEYGTDIVTLKELMGHNELKTTMIYTQIMDKRKLDAVNRIPAINL